MNKNNKFVLNASLGLLLVFSLTYFLGKSIDKVSRKRQQYRSSLIKKAYNLADLKENGGNENGILDFEEQTNLWRKMDYKGPFVKSKGESSFPSLRVPIHYKRNVKTLEKVLSIYKTN